MVAFISIFFPAFIATIIFSRLENKKLNLEFITVHYTIFEISILFIIEMVLSFIFKSQTSFLTVNTFNNIFVVKYLTISLFLACALPFLYTIIKKNVEIKLEFNKNKMLGSKVNERKKKKNKN